MSKRVSAPAFAGVVLPLTGTPPLNDKFREVHSQRLAAGNGVMTRSRCSAWALAGQRIKDTGPGVVVR